jgi:acyl-CoA synthetase (AMP-forming)/AMP-acid ligase II
MLRPILSNVTTPPEMFECQFGVPMSGAVLNTINVRLDASTIAFMLDHGEAKVLITDREFSQALGSALSMCEARPLVIDVDDRDTPGPGTATAPPIFMASPFVRSHRARRTRGFDAVSSGAAS